jgi:DDE superfamily endonuclease
LLIVTGGEIVPEIQLYCILWYIAGGSYSGIQFSTGISTASFYRVVWRTIRAIVWCKQLSIRFPNTAEEANAAADSFASVSDQWCIFNCVAAVGGYLLNIQTMPKKVAKNVSSFFSGHCQSYGVNVQGACDHLCRFSYLAVAGKGVLGDQAAVKQCGLNNLIEDLPGLLCVIGNCAYLLTEHMVPIFGGIQAKTTVNNDFNYYASQCWNPYRNGFWTNGAEMAYTWMPYLHAAG